MERMKDLENFLNIVQTLNLESGTAGEIATMYITYLYVTEAVAFVAVVGFCIAGYFVTKKVLKAIKNGDI